MDGSPPSRRERERRRHRQEILDAAQRVVADRGLEGVTVEQVAREAEFAVGSIYRHFRSKDELVQELLGVLGTRYLDEVEALICEPAPFSDRLARLTQLAYDRQVELQPVVHAWLAAPGPVPPGGTAGVEAIRALRERFRRLIGRLMAEGQASGELVGGDPRALVLAWTGMVTSFARATADGAWTDVDGAPDQLVALFLRGATPAR